MTNEEEFFAWLDGELQGEAADRVAAEVAADPELQWQAQQHRALGARLKQAFDPIAAAPVPEALKPADRTSAEVVDFAAARDSRERRRALPLWQQAAAMAATLVLGLVVGNNLNRVPPAPVAVAGGKLVASADLRQALDARLASTPADRGARIGLTFRDGSGTICRTFTDQGASGLACREGEDWRVRGLFQGPEGQVSDYRMAAGADPQLMEAVEAAIDGEPFDAAQERQAAERGWR